MDTNSRPRSRPQAQYLVSYNLISAALWVVILGRVTLLLPLVGFEHVYGGVGDFVKWTQTLALLEIVHSALGIVRSPILTTTMQVFSRLLIVWPVVTPFSRTTTPSPFYTSMLLAWSASEIIRYSYFVLNLQSGGVPSWLVWLRYSAFYVLYPVGITSECVLLWKTSQVAHDYASWALWGILVLYVPGSYILYTHMMAQRRRMMRGKAIERL